MTAENSRGGPLPTDRHTAENPDEKFIDHGTPNRHQRSDARPTVAEAHGVVGGTGRHRWLLIFRCPCCGRSHVAHGRGDLPANLERPAACGRGRLLIMPIVIGRMGSAA
jgi:hypothetical protein